jgi:hypothetical protein
VSIKIALIQFDFNLEALNNLDKSGENFTIGVQEWSSTFTGNSARPQCFGSEKNDSEWAGFGTTIFR